MNRERLTRRQVLAMVGTAGAGGAAVVGYATDNPLHRSGVERIETRRLDDSPATGTFWYSEYRSGSGLPDVDVTQLTGIQYRERDDGLLFDVIGVTMGRRSSLLAGGPVVTTHTLGVRGVGSTGTVAWDSGEADNVIGGTLKPASVVATNLSLGTDQLDDESAILRLVHSNRLRPDAAPMPDQMERDLRVVDALLDRHDGDRGRRLTRAGLLYGLYRARTDANAATPEYEGRGERYSWTPGGVRAHVVLYRGLVVSPGPDRCRFKVAQAVPRPSVVGRPHVESGLAVSFPR